MKIALLTDGIYPFSVGGMQKHSYYLAKYLAAENHKIDLYYCSVTRPADTEFQKYFSKNELNNIRFYFCPFPVMKKIPGHYIRASREYSLKISELMFQNELPDCIYAQGFCAWHLLEQKKKGKKIPPVAVNFHGLEMFQEIPGLKSKLKSLIFRKPVLFNIQNADLVFSLGGKLTGILRRITGGKEKITEIPIGIGANWLENSLAGEDNEKKFPLKFLFLGRYERRKGVEEINNAIKELSALCLSKKIEFHFIGDIPEKIKIRLPFVFHHGIIRDEKEIRNRMKKCHILVCPSSAEGMPTVILEAFSCSMSVMATDVGAVSELVNEKNGWLLSHAGQLAGAMEQAINCNEEQLEEKGKAGREKIMAEFTWDKIAKRTIDELKKLTVGQ
ncbi:MAG: glycosyltransferase family 4 protein [Bacteroidota bacterium]